MKLRFIPLLTAITFSVFSSYSQIAPDEDTGPITKCRSGFSNATRDSSEFPGGAVNDGKIDDRSCYSDYDQVNVYNKTWGVYNITAGSNHLGTKLQPRIERSLNRSKEVGVGSYARFSGTVRILEVGDAAGTGSDGTYMMQSKGKHTGGGGSPDPAICLYLVKPVLGKDANGKTVQKSFKLYREQIKFRGGSGSDGRDVVFLTDMKKNEQIEVILEVGFRQDPKDPTKRIHYSDATIGGKLFAWNIPQPERGVESGIRYGAYRVKGGRAQIRWAETDYEMKEVVYDPNAPTNSAPVVDVTAPANNATFKVGEVITLSASASDPDGNLDKVNFLINDKFHKTDSARPFTTTFTPTEAGRYKIAARAFDKTGIFKEEFISITVEEAVGAAPQVSITSPANGATFQLGQEIVFAANASDADGNLDKVNFFANNDLFKSDTSRPFDATFTPTAAGTYQIIARAIDTDNNKTDATITIEVVAPNQDPTASFDQSVVSTLEEAYTNFVVTVNANDADGDVQSVVLFIDDQEIRSEASAPYEWGHDGSPNPNETLGLSAGDHVLKAVITDNDGASITINKTITVTAKPVEVVEYFKFRNVATGEYLTNSSPSITTSADAQGDNKNWGIASNGNYSNIVNQQLETLRATGANFSGGAYSVVLATKKAPTSDSDKIWNLIFNSTNNTYRMQAGDNNRYLYQNADGSVTTSEANATDTRSMWELVPLDDVSLSIFDLEKVVKNVKLYPNPVVDKFTMSFAQVDSGEQKQIEIYSLSGKLAYTSFTEEDIAQVNLPNLSAGIYMVKVSFTGNKVFYSKLLVK